GEQHLAVACRVEGAVDALRALFTQRIGSRGIAVMHRRRMSGADQAARYRRSHRSGAHKANPHRVVALRVGPPSSADGRGATSGPRRPPESATGTPATGVWALLRPRRALAYDGWMHDVVIICGGHNGLV